MTTPLPPDSGQTISVPAQTPAPQQPVMPQVAPPQQYFTAEDLERARQQEKDKLYARLESADQKVQAFQTDLDSMKAERQAEKDALAAQQAAAVAAQQKADEEKLTVTELIAKRDSEWQQEKEQLKQQMETERVIAQRDRELFQLQSFIQRRVAEEVAQDNIAPEFVDLITGNNEAEVESSITRMKEKTASIVAGMGGSRTPASSPGVSPAGFAPSGPLDNITGTRQYTAEQIKAMNAQEYATFRAQVGIDRAGNNTGLFN